MTPVLLSFLSTTIINKLNNLLRRQLRRRLQGGSNDDVPAPAELSGPQSGIVEALVKREAGCQVREVLDELPDDDREIVLLRGIEQQSSEDVAALLGLSLDAVYKRYSRALQKLRARLPRSVFDELSN
jgi:RNA polymerase sigma factor (sigma-70 family)